MLNHELYVGDCQEILGRKPRRTFDCVIADPPDNIGLGYDQHKDRLPPAKYNQLLRQWVYAISGVAPIVWISFNAKHIAWMGYVVHELLGHNKDWKFKPCVQTFTFGNYNAHDLTNCHRPLWLLRHKDAVIYPRNVLEKSWRLLHGDPRAAPDGKIPGDVFAVSRVTGNSKQRRKWHPTQLNEKLVEKLVEFSTKPGDTVLDPFGGTGTTLRVCGRLQRQCTLIELSENYSNLILSEWNLAHKPDDPNQILRLYRKD